MSPYRGSDDALEREVTTLEGMVQLRLRRANADLKDLEASLRDLKRELRRRRAQLASPAAEPVSSEVRV